MTTVREEFEVRAAEVAGYFSFLEKVASDDARVSFTNEDGDPHDELVDKEVVKTLKATGFLLLYNLVESAMTNAISAIFDELKEKKVPFDMVRGELKKVAFKNLRKGRSDVHELISDVSIDILTAAFDRKALFSGNLDAKKIRETARVYGFSADTNGKVTRGGEQLLTVKSNRNDLGHGDKSFSEVGREHHVRDLIRLKEEVISYLRDILANIERYILERQYLSVAPAEKKEQPSAQPVAVTNMPATG